MGDDINYEKKKNFIWTTILLVGIVMVMYYAGKKHNDINQKTDKNYIKSDLNKSEINNDNNKKERVNIVNYSDCFEGISGGAIFYNSRNQEYNIYNKDLIETRASPCSTFKIISTLIGLEKGVITSKKYSYWV